MASGRLRRALGLAQGAGQAPSKASAVHLLGVVALAQGDEAAAGRLLARALELHRALGDRRGEAHELISLGASASFAGGYQRGRALSEQALELYRIVCARQGEACATGAWLTSSAGCRGANTVDLRICRSLCGPRLRRVSAV